MYYFTSYSPIKERELIQLSTDIDPEYYMALGVQLKIKASVLKNIQIRNQGDVTQAIQDVLMRWRVRQKEGSNMRATLAKALRKVGLGSLAGGVLRGSTSTMGRYTTSKFLQVW